MNLRYVCHEVERVIPWADTGGPPKVVKSYRIDALLGKAESQFLVELVQSANVRIEISRLDFVVDFRCRRSHSRRSTTAISGSSSGVG